MFEAGALSKSLESRVTAMLCGLDHKDVAGSPLFQFQNTLVKRDEIFAALRSMNAAATTPISETRLLTIFEKFWPDFEAFYETVKFESPDQAKAEEDPITKMMSVMEEVARSLQRMQHPTILTQSTYIDSQRSRVMNAGTRAGSGQRIFIIKKDGAGLKLKEAVSDVSNILV